MPVTMSHRPQNPRNTHPSSLEGRVEALENILVDDLAATRTTLTNLNRRINTVDDKIDNPDSWHNTKLSTLDKNLDTFKDNCRDKQRAAEERLDKLEARYRDLETIREDFETFRDDCHAKLEVVRDKMRGVQAWRRDLEWLRRDLDALRMNYAWWKGMFCYQFWPDAFPCPDDENDKEEEGFGGNPDKSE